MSQFLLTGTATLDIINTVSHYPREDEELRATSSQSRPGGNALNTARVLSGLGHKTELLAQIADDSGGGQILAMLGKEGIAHDHCPCTFGATPTSYITVNETNGSRTIIHYRDLPELDFSHFNALPIERFDWLHFEGRNIQETAKMLGLARQRLIDQPVSLEIEKPRPGIESLLPLADLIIFSRAYADSLGYDEAPRFLLAMKPLAPQAAMVCGWGEDGAWALAQGKRHTGETLFAPALKQQKVIDTLGAGDAFNAGLIASLATGATLEGALNDAVGLAGRKVGGHGFDHLREDRPQ